MNPLSRAAKILTLSLASMSKNENRPTGLTTTFFNRTCAEDKANCNRLTLLPLTSSTPKHNAKEPSLVQVSPLLEDTQRRQLLDSSLADASFSELLGVNKNIKIAQAAPANITTDCIGPPDPISNIPHMRFYCPPAETDTERQFRLQKMKVLEWNHKFWAAHNEKFFKEKEEFVKKYNQENAIKKKSLSPEEIAVFYKDFLDKNRSIHVNYNKEWYKKNIMLLWPAFKVSGIRLMRRLRSGSKEAS